MSHEKRTLLALVVSFIFCIIWVQMIQEKHKKWADEQEKIKTEQTKQTSEPNQINSPTPTPTPTQTQPTQTEPTPQPTQIPEEKKVSEEENIGLGVAKEEKIFTVTTEKYQIEWSNRGAVLVSAKFKEFFHNYVDRKEPNWQEDSKNWLEIIPAFSPEYRTFALTNEEEIARDGRVTKVKLSDLLWECKDGLVTKEDKTQELTFSVGPINGIIYKKIFTFFPDKYTWEGKLVLENQGEKCRRPLSLVTGSGIDLDVSEPSEAYRTIYSYIMYPDDYGRMIYKYFDYSALSSNKAKLDKNISWIGLTNRYFSYILHFQPVPAGEATYQIVNSDSKTFLPESDWINKTVALRKAWRETTNEAAIKKMQIPILIANIKAIELAPKQTFSIPFTYQIHAKNKMSSINITYKEVDDLGFFGFISRLLLWIMGIFYNIFHNYGIAIICLTLVIKLALYPLTKKQQISMAKYQKQMKVFQPELRRLQEKFRNDKQKLNEEMMKLYKQHGINPFPVGGCLPIFIQLPIFIGLYQALYYSAELRQASFLWIQDLALPDRLFHFGTNVIFLGDYFNLLPVLMTIVWVIQQKTAPKPEDPQMQQQQKIFLYMTVFFGFMFYSVASGLVLYWMVMNVFGIVEQMLIKKQIPSDEPAK